MTDDKEQYICLNCYAVGSLTTTGRCSTCDSDAVASVEQVQQVSHAARGLLVETRPTSKIQTWYHLQFGCFETVVPYTKASGLEEALEYAKSSLGEWYVVSGVKYLDGFNFNEIETKLLDHKGFNEWCRKRWPLSSTSEEQSATKEETKNEHEVAS